MKKRTLAVVMCAGIMGLAFSAKAEDRVATDELPAALLAMGGGSHDVLTTVEADEVRGEGLAVGARVKANVKVKANVNANVQALGVVHAKAKADVKVRVRARVGLGIH